MDEMIWQEHTYDIDKMPEVGFGIAISGGRDNPGYMSGDTSIIISDVVKHGPAFNKLQVNDTVVRVNGRPMYNTTHTQAVKELKNSGKRVTISVKRKALVRVDRRDTPSPGPLRRSRSRDLDYGTHRSRHRSRSRDFDHHRSRSRGGRSRSRRRYSSSRSRTPPSRSSYSPDRRSRRSRSRGRTPSPARSRRSAHSRRRSYSSSSRSRSPSPRPHNNIRSMSPLSPDPDSEKARQDPDMMVFPVKASQPKPLVLKKTRWNNAYGLKLGTRIFVQDIQPGSLADKNPDISAGDTILMINGRNVDNKTVNEAIQIIGLSKEKLTMLVKRQDGGTVSIPADRFNAPASPSKASPAAVKEPEPRHHNKDDSLSEASKRSSKASSKSISHKSDHSVPPQTEVKPDVKPSKKTIGGVQVLPAGLGSAVAAQAKERSQSHSSASTRSNTPEPAPRSKKVEEKQGHPEYALPPGEEDEEEEILPADANTIKFIKGRNVGIRLAGGNDVGIFVASVQEGSPAAKQGLKMGDQILSVNDVNFRNVIREEAVLTLMGLPAGEEVVIIAQPRPSVFQKILEHGTGDSFYVRTHFKYERSGDHEMSFKQGSIFRISDTLYQGMVGYWLAVRIGRGNMEIERGVIPNGSRAQQLKEVQDKKIMQSRERNKGGIGRRLMKNQKKGDTLKPMSTSNQPAFPAYERVVLREAGFKRPTVIFGPLADIARQRLSGDYPTMYEIARNEGVVSGQKSNRKGVIRLNMIKDIIEKDKHAILDITPNAVEKLNYAQLYPIVVFLKPASKGTVKDLRQKLAVTEDEKKKKPNKLYDRSIKMMKGYNHVFTDVIPLTQGTDDWYRKLYSTIKDQQNMPVWVSEDKLGGAEEDSEGVVVPGDDDRLSYVSAPASDYSVTTVGSEMLHSTADHDDLSDQEHDQRREEPVGRGLGGAIMPPRQKYSSSSSEEEGGDKFDDDDFGDEKHSDADEPPANKPVPPFQGGPEREHHSPSPKMQPRKAQPYEQNYRDRDASSTSSEERPPAVRPAPATAAVATRPPVVSSQRSPEPSRSLGKQEIPEGRFDPQSFLKNHIKRLNRVHDDKNEVSSEEPPPSNERIQPASVAPVHQSAPRQASPVGQDNRYSGPPQGQTSNHDNYDDLPPPPREQTSVGAEKNHTPAVLMPVASQQPWVPDPNDSYDNRPAPKPMSNYPLTGPRPFQKRPGAGPPASQPVRHEEPQRESTGRDYGREIDSFISSDPYRGSAPTRNNYSAAPNTRPPVRDEPQTQAPNTSKFRSPTTPTYRRPSEETKSPTSNYSPTKEPTTPSYLRNSYGSNNPPATSAPNYNRFGQSNQPVAPKSNYPTYNADKPSGYRPPASNGPSNTTDGPPRSRFVQDKYKDYMSQIRNPDNKAPQSNYSGSGYRPFNKTGGPPSVANKFKNGPTKDQSYDSGVDTYDIAKPKGKPEAVPVSPNSLDDDDPQVVATARGVFDSNGGVLSSVETGVSIMIPKGAISPGVKQEIYFKVCRDNTVLPPLDKNKGETLLSPLVMCGPHGLQFNHPVELRLPHCEPSQWQNMNTGEDDNCQISSNSVSVLIDHF